MIDGKKLNGMVNICVELPTTEEEWEKNKVFLTGYEGNADKLEYGERDGN